MDRLKAKRALENRKLSERDKKEEARERQKKGKKEKEKTENHGAVEKQRPTVGNNEVNKGVKGHIEEASKMVEVVKETVKKRLWYCRRRYGRLFYEAHIVLLIWGYDKRKQNSW